MLKTIIIAPRTSIKPPKNFITRDHLEEMILKKRINETCFRKPLSFHAKKEMSMKVYSLINN